MNDTVSETHQIRWWIWTLLLALAVSTSQNVLAVCFLILLVLWAVKRTAVVKRYSFLTLAGLLVVVLGIRIFFQMFFGVPVGNQVLFQLPQIELFALGLRIGGIFTFESLQTAINEALTLGGIIIALLASSMMIPTSSLVRRLPAGFSNVALILSIALSFLPELMKDVKRNLRANRWRGHSHKKLSIIALNLINVVENALERSINISASMWRRGLGSDSAVTKFDSLRLFGTILFFTSGVLAILFELHSTLIALMVIALAIIVYSSRLSLSKAPYKFKVNTASLALFGISLSVLGMWVTNTTSIEFALISLIAFFSMLLLKNQEVKSRYVTHSST